LGRNLARGEKCQMTKQGELDIKLWLVIAIVLMIILGPIVFGIKNYVSQIFYDISTAISNFLRYINAHGIVTALFILSVVIVIYLFYRIIKSISKKIKREREERKIELDRINKEREEIKKIIDKKLKFDYKETLNFIDKIKNKIRVSNEFEDLSKYNEPLKDKLERVEAYLERVEDEGYVNSLNQQKTELEEEIKRIKLEQEQNKEAILGKLIIEENRIFKKSELSDKEIEILKHGGFEQVNQFDVLEKRFIPVLIKPYEKLNHSREHIFLVWSVKRLLEHKGVKIIEEHLTKGADITFKHKRKWFALEIETGKLLRAPKQLKKKVNYLNKQYLNRWLFIVSNEKLVPRYAKFGLSTPRNRVQEMFEKLIKNTEI